MVYESMRVILWPKMKAAKIKNLAELSYRSKMPVRDLEELFEGNVEDRDIDLLNELRTFFKCKLSSLLIEGSVRRCDGNSYEAVSGVVYFIKNSATGLTKIGYTKDLINRTLNLSYEHKAEMEVTHYISTYDSYTLEQVIHNIFKDKRIEGEWFQLSNEDLAIVKSVN